jgi:hypothetical protein
MRFSVHLCQRKFLNKHLRFSIHVSHALFVPPLVSKSYAPRFCHVRTFPVQLERLKVKGEGSTRLAYTGLRGGLEHLGLDYQSI